MKFCDTHWAKLRAAITERGMGNLVPSDAMAAAEALAAGRPDPLLGAHNSIVANAMSLAGMELWGPNEDGTGRCPLCYVIQLARTEVCACGRQECTPDSRAAGLERWIDLAADGQLARITGGRAQA